MCELSAVGIRRIRRARETVEEVFSFICSVLAPALGRLELPTPRAESHDAAKSLPVGRLSPT